MRICGSTTGVCESRLGEMTRAGTGGAAVGELNDSPLMAMAMGGTLGRRIVTSTSPMIPIAAECAFKVGHRPAVNVQLLRCYWERLPHSMHACLIALLDRFIRSATVSYAFSRLTRSPRRDCAASSFCTARQDCRRRRNLPRVRRREEQPVCSGVCLSQITARRRRLD